MVRWGAAAETRSALRIVFNARADASADWFDLPEHGRC